MVGRVAANRSMEVVVVRRGTVCGKVREHVVCSQRAVLHSQKVRPSCSLVLVSLNSFSVLNTCYLEACSLDLIKSSSSLPHS